jgi:alkylation response protein AidB-like acyl-CoA dehydrogenase
MPLTRKQDDLRATIRGLLDRYPVDHDAGDGAEGRLWQRLCVEVGACGLAIPERFGGGGTGPVEVHVVMEERHAPPATGP